MKNLSNVFNTFENIVKNRVFAPKEQKFHFHKFFNTYNISKASKGVFMEYRVKIALSGENVFKKDKSDRTHLRKR